MNTHVRVGVGVIIIRDNKILLGERIGSHGAQTWATPGGHLEIGESIEDCAKREVLEETGLELEDVKTLTFTNDIFNAENKHYITLFVVAHCSNGTATVTEPDKCIQWTWCNLDELPQPLFLPLENLLDDVSNLSSMIFTSM